MNILITGITGFMGSHMVDFLLKNYADAEIHGLIRWRSPMNNLKHINPNKINLHLGDLLDQGSLSSIIDKVSPDIIFHLAAQSYVVASFKYPVATLETNIIGTANLLESVRLSGLNPIIHIASSSEVYGQVKQNEVPITEECPLRPVSPYAVSKVGEDMIAFQYFQSYGIKTIRTRSFSHTGSRRGDVFALSNFAKQVALIEKGLQDKVIKVGNLDSIRTWMDVRDVAVAYWLLVSKCSPGEVYNIGGVQTTTIREMLTSLINLSTIKEIEVVVDPSRLRPSDVTLQIPCVDKFIKVTGWKPTIKFEQTIKDTLDYWRENA